MLVLDPERTEVRYNGEWLSKLSYADVVRLARTMTVARHARARRLREALRRAASRSRSRSSSIPLMQAYDSVAVEADVELGGTDQLYNLLAGREVMQALRARAAGRADDAAPALLGRREDELVGREQHPADGARRRSSSAGRCGSPDELLAAVVRARAGAPTRRPATRWRRSSRSRASSSRRSHGEEAARAAEAHFTRVVREGQAPEEVAEVRAARRGHPCTCRRSSSTRLGVGSTSEARRLIAQGGVKVERRGGRASSTFRGAPRGRARPGRKAPIHALPRDLTPPLLLLLFPGRPDGRRRKVPDSTDRSAFGRTRIRATSEFFRGPLE